MKNIQERILDRTLYLIGKQGTVNVPIRAIIQEAEVNISAINYYFGTKEKMMNHVKQFYVNNILSTIVHLEDESLSLEDKLIRFSNEIMEYCIRFPGVTAIIKDARATKSEDEMSRRIIETTERMEMLLDEVLRSYTEIEGIQFKARRLIFLSSIVHPTEDYTEKNISSEFLGDHDKRIDYIRTVLHLIRKI